MNSPPFNPGQIFYSPPIFNVQNSPDYSNFPDMDTTTSYGSENEENIETTTEFLDDTKHNDKEHEEQNLNHH